LRQGLALERSRDWGRWHTPPTGLCAGAAAADAVLATSSARLCHFLLATIHYQLLPILLQHKLTLRLALDAITLEQQLTINPNVDLGAHQSSVRRLMRYVCV
jgi:hypothetical protein